MVAIKKWANELLWVASKWRVYVFMYFGSRRDKWVLARMYFFTLIYGGLASHVEAILRRVLEVRSCPRHIFLVKISMYINKTKWHF